MFASTVWLCKRVGSSFRPTGRSVLYQLHTLLRFLQELLLILEEYWERNPDLRNVPIYQASALARRAMSIYQTYIEMMNDDIQAAFQVLWQRSQFEPSEWTLLAMCDGRDSGSHDRCK